MSNTPNLFTQESNTGANQENQIDTKFQNRQENFSSEENFSKIKENTMENELTLGQDYRNKIFMQRRLRKKTNTESIKSLKEKLTVPLELYEQCNSMTVQPSEFNNIIESFRTQDIKKKYSGLVGIRKLLCFQNDAPIQQLIDIGIVQELIELLSSAPPEFQYEALWCLTNIASGTSDQANSIVIKGGIPSIMTLMDSNIEELKNQAIWTIGNLANDSQKIRDLLLSKEKAFDKILTILATTSHNQLIKTCTWAISNFCRVKPIPAYEYLKKSISMISRAIVTLPNDTEFLTDACFILSFMTEHYKDTINDLMDIGVVKNIITLLDVDVQYVQLSCLRIVGNIASGNANQTQMLLDWGVLDYLKRTLNVQKKSIRKESAWIISNIAAGTQKQIETLIDQDFLPILSNVIANDEIEIKKEAIWAVSNLTSVEKPQSLQKICEQGILKILCNCLKMKDAKYLAVCLEALGNLLSFGKKNSQGGINPMVIEIENMGMIDVLEKLQYHPVEIVYEKTLKLLESYFETENIEEVGKFD